MGKTNGEAAIKQARKKKHTRHARQAVKAHKAHKAHAHKAQHKTQARQNADLGLADLVLCLLRARLPQNVSFVRMPQHSPSRTALSRPDLEDGKEALDANADANTGHLPA